MQSMPGIIAATNEMRQTSRLNLGLLLSRDSPAASTLELLSAEKARRKEVERKEKEVFNIEKYLHPTHSTHPHDSKPTLLSQFPPPSSDLSAPPPRTMHNAVSSLGSLLSHPSMLQQLMSHSSSSGVGEGDMTDRQRQEEKELLAGKNSSRRLRATAAVTAAKDDARGGMQTERGPRRDRNLQDPNQPPQQPLTHRFSTPPQQTQKQQQQQQLQLLQPRRSALNLLVSLTGTPRPEKPSEESERKKRNAAHKARAEATLQGENQAFASISLSLSAPAPASAASSTSHLQLFRLTSSTASSSIAPTLAPSLHLSPHVFLPRVERYSLETKGQARARKAKELLDRSISIGPSSTNPNGPDSPKAPGGITLHLDALDEMSVHIQQLQRQRYENTMPILPFAQKERSNQSIASLTGQKLSAAAPSPLSSPSNSNSNASASTRFSRKLQEETHQFAAMLKREYEQRFKSSGLVSPKSKEQDKSPPKGKRADKRKKDRSSLLLKQNSLLRATDSGGSTGVSQSGSSASIEASMSQPQHTLRRTSRSIVNVTQGQENEQEQITETTTTSYKQAAEEMMASKREAEGEEQSDSKSNKDPADDDAIDEEEDDSSPIYKLAIETSEGDDEIIQPSDATDPSTATSSASLPPQPKSSPRSLLLGKSLAKGAAEPSAPSKMKNERQVYPSSTTTSTSASSSNTTSTSSLRLPTAGGGLSRLTDSDSVRSLPHVSIQVFDPSSSSSSASSAAAAAKAKGGRATKDPRNALRGSPSAASSAASSLTLLPIPSHAAGFSAYSTSLSTLSRSNPHISPDKSHSWHGALQARHGFLSRDDNRLLRDLHIANSTPWLANSNHEVREEISNAQWQTQLEDTLEHTMKQTLLRRLDALDTSEDTIAHMKRAEASFSLTLAQAREAQSEELAKRHAEHTKYFDELAEKYAAAVEVDRQTSLAELIHRCERNIAEEMKEDADLLETDRIEREAFERERREERMNIVAQESERRAALASLMRAEKEKRRKEELEAEQRRRAYLIQQEELRKIAAWNGKRQTARRGILTMRILRCENLPFLSDANRLVPAAQRDEFRFGFQLRFNAANLPSSHPIYTPFFQTDELTNTSGAIFNTEYKFEVNNAALQKMCVVLEQIPTSEIDKKKNRDIALFNHQFSQTSAGGKIISALHNLNSKGAHDAHTLYSLKESDQVVEEGGGKGGASNQIVSQNLGIPPQYAHTRYAGQLTVPVLQVRAQEGGIVRSQMQLQHVKHHHALASNATSNATSPAATRPTTRNRRSNTPATAASSSAAATAAAGPSSSFPSTCGPVPFLHLEFRLRPIFVQTKGGGGQAVLESMEHIEADLAAEWDPYELVWNKQWQIDPDAIEEAANGSSSSSGAATTNASKEGTQASSRARSPVQAPPSESSSRSASPTRAEGSFGSRPIQPLSLPPSPRKGGSQTQGAANSTNGTNNKESRGGGGTMRAQIEGSASTTTSSSSSSSSGSKQIVVGNFQEVPSPSSSPSLSFDDSSRSSSTTSSSRPSFSNAPLRSHTDRGKQKPLPFQHVVAVDRTPNRSAYHSPAGSRPSSSRGVAHQQIQMPYTNIEGETMMGMPHPHTHSPFSPVHNSRGVVIEMNGRTSRSNRWGGEEGEEEEEDAQHGQGSASALQAFLAAFMGEQETPPPYPRLDRVPSTTHSHASHSRSNSRSHSRSHSRSDATVQNTPPSAAAAAPTPPLAAPYVVHSAQHLLNHQRRPSFSSIIGVGAPPSSSSSSSSPSSHPAPEPIWSGSTNSYLSSSRDRRPSFSGLDSSAADAARLASQAHQANLERERERGTQQQQHPPPGLNRANSSSPASNGHHRRAISLDRQMSVQNASAAAGSVTANNNNNNEPPSPSLASALGPVASHLFTRPAHVRTRSLGIVTAPSPSSADSQPSSPSAVSAHSPSSSPSPSSRPHSPASANEHGGGAVGYNKTQGNYQPSSRAM